MLCICILCIYNILQVHVYMVIHLQQLYTGTYFRYCDFLGHVRTLCSGFYMYYTHWYILNVNIGYLQGSLND